MKQKRHGINVVDQLAALRRYARSLVRNSDDAEDLVHDTLVRAYERQGTFHTDGNVRNWLMSILHNVHVDRLRRSRSLARRHENAADLIEPSAPASQDLSVRLAQVQAAFADLPDEQRAALHLVAIEELSYQEAAEVLRIPVGTLMSRISRARARLRSFEEQGTARPRHLRIIGGADNEDN